MIGAWVIPAAVSAVAVAVTYWVERDWRRNAGYPNPAGIFQFFFLVLPSWAMALIAWLAWGVWALMDAGVIG